MHLGGGNEPSPEVDWVFGIWRFEFRGISSGEMERNSKIEEVRSIEWWGIIKENPFPNTCPPYVHLHARSFRFTIISHDNPKSR